MCGATSGQTQIAQQQTNLSKQIMQQGSTIFGNSSSVFGDLMNTFSPTVAAGPSQEGFSAPEKSSMQSEAITDTGNAYRNADQATKEASAAVGGGNVALPSGATIGRNLSVANSAAAQTSSELQQIEQADYATGRQNYDTAVAGLSQAPSVFNPATSASNASTSSGEAAANTENQIAQEDNSWETAAIGALSGIAGSVATGGMSNLGKGVGFFGGNAPAPTAG